MITKKDVPYDMLKIIEPLAQANLDIIQFRRDDNTYYSFVETDSNSKNIFRILIDGTKRITNYDKSKYAFEWKPNSSSSVKLSISQADLKDIGNQFKNWLQLIREIHETPSVHDDNFVNSYTEFYYEEFKIVDEDANTSPFDPNQQELVELYLNSLSIVIEQSADSLSETSKAEIISDIKDIESSLTITTKSQVMKKMSRVFAKIYKSSRRLAKDIIKEAKKQLIKKLIELGIEYGPKLLEGLKNGS